MNGKNNKSQITDIEISFSPVMQISKQDTLFNNLNSATMSYGRFENQGKGIEESSVTWWLRMPYKMLKYLEKR